MRLFLRVSAAAGLLVTVSILMLSAVHGSAGEYGSGSSMVTELTPATLDRFVNSHKPVVVLFYAPWCGHCKNFQHQYENFAQAVKGTIRVGAINADAHRDVGARFDVRGFPTIKVWHMGEKKVSSPKEFEGARTARSLQTFVMSGISTSRVRTASTSSALQAVLRQSPNKKIGVLYSTMKVTPMMFSVLSSSPKLKDISFVFAGDGASNSAAAANNITKFPTIALIKEENGVPTTHVYSGKIEYEGIAKFFLANM